jgi:hypothetical protein
MRIIMTFLCCDFLLFFPQGFRSFYKHLVYTFSDFPTDFFEDKVHST